MVPSPNRELDNEFQDNEHRNYAYDLDYRMHKYMMRTFDPYLLDGNALEMGCFEGGFTQRLAKIYEDVTVVEGSGDLVAVASKKLGDKVKFHTSWFEKFEPGRQFDNIFLMHTLEHIDDPVALLVRIRGWLKSTGRLFLAVPNAEAASRQIAVAIGLIEHTCSVTEGEALHGHQRTYRMDTLKLDAKRAGLTIESSGGVFFKPLANFQFDKAMQSGIIDDRYLDGCYEVGKLYPTLCASIYVICSA
jgi:2-polyprenyl-3-methyl-5-hydroxy-6-metoxy-1,4-benzoquinol methylase